MVHLQIRFLTYFVYNCSEVFLYALCRAKCVEFKLRFLSYTLGTLRLIFLIAFGKV